MLRNIFPQLILSPLAKLTLFKLSGTPPCSRSFNTTPHFLLTCVWCGGHTANLVLLENMLCRRVFSFEVTDNQLNIPTETDPVVSYGGNDATSPDRSRCHMNEVLNIVRRALHVKQRGKETLHPLLKLASAWSRGPGKRSVAYGPRPGTLESASSSVTSSIHLSTSLDSCEDSVQLLSRIRLFATPWTAAHQASLSIINSWSLLKPMPVESVMPSKHLSPCCPLLLE